MIISKKLLPLGQHSVIIGWDVVNYQQTTEVGIYKRKQESKKTRKQENKKENKNSTKKPTKKTIKKKRKFSFFLGRFLCRERVFFLFFLIAFLV